MRKLCFGLLLLASLFAPSSLFARIEGCESKLGIGIEDIQKNVSDFINLFQGNPEQVIAESPLCPSQFLAGLEIINQLGIDVNQDQVANVRRLLEKYLNNSSSSENETPRSDGENTSKDNTPPTINAPNSLTFEANCGEKTAEVLIQVSVNDDSGVPPSITYWINNNEQVANPMRLPIGKHLIVIRAKDQAENEAVHDLAIIVLQRECQVKKAIGLPRIDTPKDIHTVIEPKSAVIEFDTKAWSADGEPLKVVYKANGKTVRSGDTFPVGKTRITAIATDQHGQTVSTEFDVNIRVADQIAPSWPDRDELQPFEPLQSTLDFNDPKSWLIPGNYIALIREATHPNQREELLERFGLKPHQIGRIFHDGVNGFELFANEDEVKKIRKKFGNQIDLGQSYHLTSFSKTNSASHSAVLDWLDRGQTPLDNTFNRQVEKIDVKVYVVDSGIRDDHLTLSDKIVGWRGVAAGLGGSSAHACNRHGTAMAALIGSEDYSATQRAQIIDVNVAPCGDDVALNEAPKMSVTDIVAAVDWITQQEKCEIGDACEPFVVNMSLGAPAGWGLQKDDPDYIRTLALEHAIENLVENTNAIVVAAAGNKAQNACSIVPAHMLEVITIGGVDFNRDGSAKLWEESNWGPCVNNYAPAVEQATADSATEQEIRKASGTSGAAAIVSGVIAHWLAMEIPKDDILNKVIAYPTNKEARLDYINNSTSYPRSSEFAEGFSAIASNWSKTCLVKTNDGELNIRNEPNTSAKILMTLKNGDAVEVLEQQDRWLRIRTADGIMGWGARSGKIGTYLWEENYEKICSYE